MARGRRMLSTGGKRSAAPLVSVVTPCLNAGPFIEDAILCVANQEYRNVEHIIMDGGSTDGTVGVLRMYEDTARLRWSSEPDRSPADAVNKGLKRARGEIVCVLPADDLFFPWTLATVVDHFESHPRADVVYGDVVEQKTDGPYGFVWSYPSGEGVNSRLKHIPLGGTSLFWRRRVSDELGGFDESLKVVADWDFTLRAMKSFELSKAQEVLSCFRYRAESRSIAGDYEAEKGRIKSEYFGEPSLTLGELVYRVGWSAQYVGTLVGLAVATMARESARWSRFSRSGLVSKRRLLAEIPLAPLVSTFVRLERRVDHGYVDSRRLRSLCVAGSPAREKAEDG